MKKRLIAVTLMLCVIVSTLTSCSGSSNNLNASQIADVCELATVECRYHNFIKKVQPKGVGLTHIGEKDREYFLEYDGTVKFGINCDNLQVSNAEESNVVTIVLPQAQRLSVEIDEDSFNFVEDKDSWVNKNKITLEKTNESFSEAEAELEKVADADEYHISMARERAKSSIEQYINAIGKKTGTKYKVHWIEA